MKTEIVKVAVTAFTLGAGYIAVRHLARFRDRTLDDVIGYLRKIDWQEVSKLFDVHEEENLIGFWTRRDFRRSQRARLDLAGEFLECMVHNNRILSQWGRTERKDMVRHHLEYDLETVEGITQLIRATAEFRKIAFIVICKIRFLSLLNFDKLRILPVPSVPALRKVRHSDLLQAFESVIKAAAALATVYGEEFVQEITATM